MVRFLDTSNTWYQSHWSCCWASCLSWFLLAILGDGLRPKGEEIIHQYQAKCLHSTQWQTNTYQALRSSSLCPSNLAPIPPSSVQTRQFWNQPPWSWACSWEGESSLPSHHKQSVAVALTRIIIHLRGNGREDLGVAWCCIYCLEDFARSSSPTGRISRIFWRCLGDVALIHSWVCSGWCHCLCFIFRVLLSVHVDQ